MLNIIDIMSIIFIIWGIQGFFQNWGLYLSYMMSMELFSMGISSSFMVMSSFDIINFLGLAYGMMMLIFLALESAMVLTMLANLCALKMNNNKIPHFNFLKFN